MTEQSAIARPARLPQMLGRLGLYATYVAAALVLLVIAGDLDVLVRHASLVGQLALLVSTGPLVAMLLSTFASYVNYFGVWRILRGKDEYDAGQDLKSHASDVPQALQTLLAGRSGCLPAASTALLAFSLLLVLATTLPSQTPFIGELGAWHAGPGARTVGATPPAAPTVIPTATLAGAPKSTATPRTAPTATPRPVPTGTATPTSTPPPPVINFSVSPTAASWNCHNQGMVPGAVTITLDNSRSTVAVGWSATVVETVAGSPWAAASPSSGTVPAAGTQTLTITPDPAGSGAVCVNSAANGTPWHVSIATDRAGTYTFTDTIYYYLT